MQNQVMKIAKATSATPPITPPTMVAIGTDLVVLVLLMVGLPVELLEEPLDVLVAAPLALFPNVGAGWVTVTVVGITCDVPPPARGIADEEPEAVDTSTAVEK